MVDGQPAAHTEQVCQIAGVQAQQIAERGFPAKLLCFDGRENRVETQSCQHFPLGHVYETAQQLLDELRVLQVGLEGREPRAQLAESSVHVVHFDLQRLL